MSPYELGPTEFQQRLLPTAPDALSPDVAHRLLCGQSPRIEVGFVCNVEIERQGEPLMERLAFAVKLDRSVSGPEDLGDTPIDLFQRFLVADCKLMQDHANCDQFAATHFTTLASTDRVSAAAQYEAMGRAARAERLLAEVRVLQVHLPSG